MNRTTVLLGTAATALVLCSSAFALPPAGAERGGGDTAPRPALLKPAHKPLAGAPAAQPDTSALMPSGPYVLRVTMSQRTQTHPVTVVRNGGAVAATVDGNETLTGTLDPTGKLQLAGDNTGDRVSFAATVQNYHASGSIQLSRGASTRSGTFTLDPDTGGPKGSGLKEYKEPGKPGGGGGSCSLWCEFKKLFTLG